MLDGRHTGTGGGNHIVARRRRRRPTARSCAGPTCCAACSATGTTIRRCRTCSPACSSARPARRRASTRRGNDSLYELEIAFAQIRRRGDADAAVAGRSHLPQPAGRRHRQHPPRRVLHRQAVLARTRASGRLGLLELRAFEMPPHARMSLAQQLLLRALVARFWQTPYDAHARRAGAPSCTIASCCRTSSRRISTTCSTICSDAGYRVRARVVRAALRVPLPAASATSRTRGVDARAAPGARAVARAGRGAGAAGGTVRYVDSSVERLQVKVDRADRRPPRRRLQRPARAAAADRHAPASTWPACATAPGSRRSACTRRSPCTRRWCSTSSTPGSSGRSAAARITSRIPAAAATRRSRSTRYEAESRRLARFFAHRPHAGPGAPCRRRSATREFPFTLDLRRPPMTRSTRRVTRSAAARCRATATSAACSTTTSPTPAPTTRCSTAPGALRPHWRAVRRASLDGARRATSSSRGCETRAPR